MRAGVVDTRAPALWSKGRAALDALQIIVAIGTWALVGVTIWLVKGQLSIAKEQRKIQLFLELRKEFDGSLLSERKLLAQQLLDNKLTRKLTSLCRIFFKIWECFLGGIILTER